MNKVKIAIVGIGHLGSKHLKVLSELSDKVEIVGICDIKEERTQRLAGHYNIPFVQDPASLVGRIDAVNICVPTESHHAVAKFFLAHRIHTFIEKPMTTTLAQAEELIQLAQKHSVKIQVGHVERFNAAFQSIKHFTHRPLFIECHRLNQFPNRSLDIGVVMDLMIHDIDIILGVLQGPLKDVQAIGVPVLTPAFG